MTAQKLIVGFQLLVLSLLLVIFLIPTPTFAAEPTPAPLSKENFNYFINGQTTIEGAVGHTILCGLAGFSPLNKEGCLGYAGNEQGGTSPIVFNKLPSGGALGGVSRGIAMLYTPPTSSMYYLARLGENLGIAPKSAYALTIPGSGQNIIQPVLSIWTISRNFAYLAFIIIFLVIGVMIMLRQKINPQTVITVQQALPSLIIGLFLVSISYYIAALLIDLTFLGLRLVTELFIASGAQNSFASGGGKDLDSLRELGRNSNVMQLFAGAGFNGNSLGVVFDGTRNQAVDFLGGNFLGGTLQRVIPAIIGAIAGFFLGLGPWGAVVGGGIGAGVGGLAVDAVIPVLLIAILLIALFFQSLRLLFGLINSYIQILFFTLAGPFFILVGSIPGRGGAIGAWWRGLLANALVFPAVFGVFLFAGVILGDAGSWTTTSVPLFGGVDGNFLRALIAYGILLGSPSIPDIVRNALGVKGPQAFAQAALGGFSSGLAPVSAGLGRGGRELWQRAPIIERRRQERELEAERRKERERLAVQRAFRAEQGEH